MNWITTNIRFPEEQYMELKIEAAKKRVSFASLVREKITTTTLKSDSKSKAKINKSAEKLLRKFKKVAKEISKETKGIDLSKALIEMRYEQ